MPTSVLKRALGISLAAGLIGCGAHDRSLPTRPDAVAPAAGVPVSPEAMPVSVSGSKPAGFQGVFRVDPKPDEQGVIHGDSPITVTFDVCGSTAGAGGPLTYLFDWDDDGKPDVVASGDDCRKEHRFDSRNLPPGKGTGELEANVCVVSGNPQSHGPNTYFSCRSYAIAPQGFIHHTGWGQTWFNDVRTGTISVEQALANCRKYVQAAHTGATCGGLHICGCDSLEECVYDSTEFKIWFYAGPFEGRTTPDTCAIGEAWD